LNDLTHREENVGEHRLKIQGRGGVPFGFEKFERRLRIHFFRVLLDFCYNFSENFLGRFELFKLFILSPSFH
jgi:hypothetical protein